MPKLLITFFVAIVQPRLHWTRRSAICTHRGLLQPLQRRAFFISVLASGLLLTFLFGLFIWSQYRGRHDAQLTRVALERMVIGMQNEFSTGSPTRSLDSAIAGKVDASVVSTAIQGLAIANKVELLKFAPSKETENQSMHGLHRYILDVRLSGGYLDLKNYLAQLLIQTPGLWVARLQLQAEGSTLIATISLRGWSIDNRPAPQARSSVTP